MTNEILLNGISIETLTNVFNTMLDEKLQPILTAVTEQSESNLPEYLTRKETAELLGISLPTLNEWTKKGTIQGHRINTRVRYKRSEIENALKEIKTIKYRRA